MVRQYCCCVSNLKATKILAVLAVISSVIGLGYYGFAATAAKVPEVLLGIKYQPFAFCYCRGAPRACSKSQQKL